MSHPPAAAPSLFFLSRVIHTVGTSNRGRMNSIGVDDMPTKVEMAKFSIRGKVKESAANTYTEVSIATNLVAQGNALFMSTGLWLSLDPGGALATADELYCHIAYSAQSFVIGPDDPDFIWGRAWQNIGAAAVLEQITYVPVDHFPLAATNLYFGIQGVSLAQAATARFKLAGYLQKVSTTDFFRIVNLR